MSRRQGSESIAALVNHWRWLEAQGPSYKRQAASCKRQATSYKQRAASLTKFRNRII